MLTAGGAVIIICYSCVRWNWDDVRKEKRNEKHQIEMILPSVLSEASSLVAKRNREKVEEREGDDEDMKTE